MHKTLGGAGLPWKSSPVSLVRGCQEDFIAMSVHRQSMLMIHFNEVEQWHKLTKSALKSLHAYVCIKMSSLI